MSGESEAFLAPVRTLVSYIAKLRRPASARPVVQRDTRAELLAEYKVAVTHLQEQQKQTYIRREALARLAGAIEREFEVILRNRLVESVNYFGERIEITTRWLTCTVPGGFLPDPTVFVLGPMRITIPLISTRIDDITIAPIPGSPFLSASEDRCVPHDFATGNNVFRWMRCWGSFADALARSLSAGCYGDVVSVTLDSLRTANGMDDLGSAVKFWPRLLSLDPELQARVLEQQQAPRLDDDEVLARTTTLIDEYRADLTRKLDASSNALRQSMDARDDLARRIVHSYHVEYANGKVGESPTILFSNCTSAFNSINSMDGWKVVSVSADSLDVQLPSYGAIPMSGGPAYRIPPHVLRLSLADGGPFIRLLARSGSPNVAVPPGVDKRGRIIGSLPDSALESLGSLDFPRFLNAVLHTLRQPGSYVSLPDFERFPISL